MSSTYHRYEAAVKLSNGRVVIYHNINTGLKKFHRFLCEKFESPDRWVSYFVRRKDNKEIIGKYKNSVIGKEQWAVTIFTATMDNEKRTGAFIPIIYERNGNEIIRNMFVANKTIIKRNSLLITIPEWLFDKILAESKKELLAYYQKEKQKSFILEITLSEKMFFLKEKVITESIPGTEPEQDYP